MRNKLTEDRMTLFVDQYGGKIWASSLAGLKLGAAYSGGARKQYQDKRDGRIVWTGYVLGSRWFTAFRPVEVEHGNS